MIGNNLKKYRKLLGYSKSFIAKSLQVSPVTVTAWEMGIARPNEQNLNLLSKIFCISKEELTKIDENFASCNKVNLNLLTLNVLIALFCMTAIVALWRFSPQIIPAHWTGATIDRYGKKTELFFHIVSIFIFFIIDISAYFPLKAEGSKVATYVTHCLMIFFQIGYTAMIIGTYLKYLQSVLPFAICILASLFAFLSISIHPKVIGKSFLTKSAISGKTLSIASYVLSIIFLTVYVLSIIPIMTFS